MWVIRVLNELLTRVFLEQPLAKSVGLLLAEFFFARMVLLWTSRPSIDVRAAVTQSSARHGNSASRSGNQIGTWTTFSFYTIFRIKNKEPMTIINFYGVRINPYNIV